MKNNSSAKKITVVIPARYNSARFMGKALAKIAGRPMIYHVYSRAKKSRVADSIIVATDDERIRRCVEDFGGEAVLTSSSHQTGTDRIAEVAKDISSEIIVNVQGDEPLLNPRMIEEAVRPLLVESTASAVTLMNKIRNPADFTDVSKVKVVVDLFQNVLFMSRACIPYPKTRINYAVYKQVGLYAFRREYLLRFASMKQTPLELIEGIELLRMLENGHALKAVLTRYSTFGVDTPSDLMEVNKIMSRPKQRK